MSHIKPGKTSHLFPNRLTKEEEIRKRELEARRSYDEEMDRHEAYIHHLNRENGLGRKSNVQK